MSTTRSNNTSEATLALLDHMKGLDLSLVLGYSDTTQTQNSTNSYADSIANSSVAFRIKHSDIKSVVSVAEQGGNRKWTEGTIPGAWKASGETGRQYLYESKGGVVFMVTGFPGNNYRSDQEGSIISTEMFTDISGNFATTSDGIEYIAINASPTGINSLSSKYIELDLPEDALGKKLERSTSLSTNASNICGSGNEQLIGTCCLYYKTNGYDSVAGVTHVAGGFHSCDCVRCYRCIELAKALDMKYVFTGGTGSTGATCGCLADGQETYPTDCGPCACNIDWDSTSEYESVLSNRNYPETSSANRNATIVKNQKENGGGIASITMNLAGLTDSQLTLASSYETNASNGTLYVPLIGSCEEEALWEVSTVRDGVSYQYRADGIKKSTVRGKNYTAVSLNEGEWAKRFPGIPADRVSINPMPINGFASNLTSLLPISFVIHKVINKSDITSVTDATVFNFFTISSLKDSKGASLYAGYAPEQSNIKNLVPQFRLGFVGSGFRDDKMPTKNQVLTNETDGASSTFTSTTVKEVTPSDASAAGGFASGVIFADIMTPFPNSKVGTTVKTSAGDSYTVDAIVSKPTGSTNEDYDATKQKIIHRGSLGTFSLSGSNQIQTLLVELQMGALNQSVS
jgi:hypothetical protein